MAFFGTFKKPKFYPKKVQKMASETISVFCEKSKKRHFRQIMTRYLGTFFANEKK